VHRLVRLSSDQALPFNRADRKNLETRQLWEADPVDAIRIVMLETDRLERVWDAWCDFYHVTVRRQALKKLQEMLGAEDFCAGDLPPYVPEWRFSQAQ